MRLEEFLKNTLEYSIVKPTRHHGGGCISQGQSYEVDGGQKIFVKQNSSKMAKVMFNGEFESLKAIEETQTIKVPHPITVLKNPIVDGGYMLIMEHLDLKHCSEQSKLGKKLAKLHLINIQKGISKSPDYVDKFGFDVPTSCGSIPQKNTWHDNWPEYYAFKLEEQIEMIQRDYDDKEVKKLWPILKSKLPTFFEGLNIKPSLLHGDLWSGNIGQVGDECTIFDAASFYGHHEYDLGIAGMFGGFSNEFYKNYHDEIPKESGFEERHLLYKLFHNLNHWNHFGSSYRSGSVSIIKRLID